MKTQLVILLVMLAALFAAAPAASAQGCDGWYGGGWGYGMGYLYNSLDYNVPYFAAHPPVYYSYPVPRTYGYSPFAYPPYTKTPDVVMDEQHPVQIINPYVPNSQQTPAASVDQSVTSPSPASHQPQPLVIVNPYVNGAGAMARLGE